MKVPDLEGRGGKEVKEENEPWALSRTYRNCFPKP
jgi:hypothetical protein